MASQLTVDRSGVLHRAHSTTLLRLSPKTFAPCIPQDDLGVFLDMTRAPRVCTPWQPRLVRYSNGFHTEFASIPIKGFCILTDDFRLTSTIMVTHSQVLHHDSIFDCHSDHDTLRYSLRFNLSWRSRYSQVLATTRLFPRLLRVSDEFFRTSNLLAIDCLGMFEE